MLFDWTALNFRFKMTDEAEGRWNLATVAAFMML